MGLKKQVCELIDTMEDDAQLAAELQKLSRDNWKMPQVLARHMPQLYRRNRTIFLPLLERFANSWGLRNVKDLDEWRDEVEANKDFRLFVAIYQTQLNRMGDWTKAADKWRADLLGEFRNAPDRVTRREVLDKYRLSYDITDDLAAEMYAIDPVLTRVRVNDWLDFVRWHDESFTETAEAARSAGDEEFYFELYRQTFYSDTFREDALRLCAEIADPARLCDELERRHLVGEDGESAVHHDVLLKLLELRGRDVIPYLSRVIPNTYSWSNSSDFQQMAVIAEQHGWWDLWAVVVQNHTNFADFQVLVERLCEDRDRPDWRVAAQLSLLAGAKHGWRQWQSFVALSDQAALKLYERFETFARGAFAPHFVCTPTRGREPGRSYTELAQLAMQRDDTAMVDLLGSRALASHYRWGRQNVANVDWYVEHYQRLEDSEFARRALDVLGRLDEFEVYQTSSVRERNPLYPVFFGQPHRYVSVADQLADFLEANNADVHLLGLRVLRQLEPATVAEIAARHLHHLLAYMLNRSRRSTRIAAFEALALASGQSEELGRLVASRARETLRLRQQFYPRDRLIELIGRAIHRWPALRSESERPVIYDRAEAS